MQDARDDLRAAQVQLEAAAAGVEGGSGEGGALAQAQVQDAREKAAAYLEEAKAQQQVRCAAWLMLGGL